jgi:hypothetical protein
LSLTTGHLIGNTVNETIKITGGDPGLDKGNQWNGISVEDISSSLENGQIDESNYLSIKHDGKTSSFHVRGLVPIIEQINKQVQVVVEKTQGVVEGRQKERLPDAQSKVNRAGELCDKISVKLLENDKKKGSFSKFMEKCYNKLAYGEFETSASFIIRDVSTHQEKLASALISLNSIAEGFTSFNTTTGRNSITKSDIAVKRVPAELSRVAKMTKSLWGIFKS